MRPVLERCDREGVPAYLEASSERSMRLYERLGWEFTGEAVRLPEGPGTVGTVGAVGLVGASRET